MTKVRPPLSIENTLYGMFPQLGGIEAAAEVTGRQPSYLRDCADQDRDQQLTVRDLRLLDLKHDELHGTGFPLAEALLRDMGSARAEKFADSAAIGRHAVKLADENGQAVSALLEATLNPGDPAKLRKALREAEDVDREVGEAIATIRTAIEHGATEAPP